MADRPAPPRERAPADCAICFEDRTLSALRPCDHAFCGRCLRRLLRTSCRCPVCRGVFVDCDPPLVAIDKAARRVVLTRAQGEDYGMGLEQLAGGAVAVAAVAQTGRAKAAGVREDAKVVALNGLPCYSKACVQMQLQSVDTAQLALVSSRKQPSDARSAPSCASACSGVLACLAKCGGHLCACLA